MNIVVYGKAKQKEAPILGAFHSLIPGNLGVGLRGKKLIHAMHEP